MVTYYIEDSNPPNSKANPFKSPKAHFWKPVGQDIRQKVQEVVEYYRDIKTVLMGTPPS